MLPSDVIKRRITAYRYARKRTKLYVAEVIWMLNDESAPFEQFRQHTIPNNIRSIEITANSSQNAIKAMEKFISRAYEFRGLTEPIIKQQRSAIIAELWNEKERLAEFLLNEENLLTRMRE